ncbi:nucleic acid/nucleotide deaminase domain-containing protein [Paenibacillus agilis]|uniref:Uncharacterized protein n=1 Tax=Paenibacillus agilis TaxID=3020863 RepID=A0A559IW74_9BACL|nr:nucleic acid/nucleotide deaminase domain-containing protein [Paenibacillus agilis]TVX91889.1 hypothetical protein FPZ44_01720 [Paenibacillus agilis]
MMNDEHAGESSELVTQDDEHLGRREAERLERAIQLEAESAATGAKLKAELKQLYDRTERNFRRMVNDFYGRYGSRSSSRNAAGMIETKQVLPYDQAVKRIKAAEMKEWKDSVALWESRIQKESDPATRERLQAKLKEIICGTSPPNTRFDVLSWQMLMALEELDSAGTQQMGKTFETLLMDVYTEKISDIKQRDEDSLNAEEIAKVLSNPWNGTTFSDRLTMNMRKLQYHLRETIVQGLIQGKSSSAVVKDLGTRMGASFKQVERIIDTESVHFHSEAMLVAASKPDSDDRVAKPTLPKQVGYGETDLSLKVQQHRVGNKIFDLRNLVAADVEIDGVRTLKIFESTERLVIKPNGKEELKKVHSEKILLEEKNDMIANGYTYIVHRVYTEREPCNLGGHDCKKLLADELPDAEVSYSVEYGGEKESRARGNAALANELKKLEERENGI